MKKTIALLMTLMLGVLVLAGCGNGASNEAALSGKYYVISVTEGEATVSEETLKAMGFDQMYFEFMEDGTFKGDIMGETGEGTFKVDGKNATLTVNGEDAKGTIDGNKFTLEIDDTKMVFEKK